MKNLRTAFIRIAHENPETRKTLLPLVKQADKWEKMPKGWTDESRKQFWDKITGDVKHKVTKCIKEMEGKFDDPGAFCASLADRVDPGWRSRTAMEHTASTVNPAPFSQWDWSSYSGASSFEDGSDPIIAHSTLEATIIADAEGIQLMLMGEDSTTDTIYHKNRSFPSQKEATKAAQDALHSIRSGRIPPGFKPL